MENSIAQIIKNEQQNTVTLFYKNDFFYIHTKQNYFDKFQNITDSISKNKEIKISTNQYSELINFILRTLKMEIKEYHFSEENYSLQKEASLTNWNDYADILFENSHQPITSIHFEKNYLFVAFYNIENNTIYHAKFEDDDIFSNLYSFLTEINSNEVIFENLKLEKILANMGISFTYIKNKNDAISMLKEFLSIKDCNLEEYNMNLFMQIDKKTILNLDLDHILKILEPQTKQGKRLLNSFLRQPLKDINEIEKRHFFVDYFYYINSNIIKGFPDYITFSKRILKLKIKDCVVIIESLKKVKDLIQELNSKTNETIYNEFILPLINIDEANQQLFEEAEKIIDLETCELKDDINENIDNLKQKKKDLQEKIKEEHERVLKINKKIKLENISGNGVFSFKIPRSEFKIMKENNFVEKSILKGGIVFTTLLMEKCNEELGIILKDYEDEEKHILNNFLLFMNNYSSSFDVLNHLIAQIDVFVSFSRSIDYNFTKPEFKDFFKIKGSFHPLVKECVKNSFELGNQDNIDNNRFCVITGPNMGGKSTFMKQCAVMCILAQIGCFVPCENAILPIVDGIYLRIGANDNSSAGLSTFMVEMNDIARICKKATDKSLVIIDELGRGTSAIDGLSLALSVKEFLIQKKSFTLFATHFPEICSEDVVNKRVKCVFDKNELTLLYEIEDGKCELSFGVEIAEKIDFPDEIVLMARELLAKKN